MAAWKHVGYRDGGRLNYSYAYWTNGEDVAIEQFGPNDCIEVNSNIPPAAADIEYGVVADEYDCDVVYWMEDWRITPDDL